MSYRSTLASFMVAGLAASAAAQNVPGLRYIGEHIIPTGSIYNGTQVGGLSGIDFDPASNSYYAISDDRSSLNPARFYNLNFNFDQNAVFGVDFNSVTTMLRPDGTAFPVNQVDPEAIRFDKSTGKFFWSSEGERVIGTPSDLQNPFVREMNIDGSYSREMNTPARYNPTEMEYGIRRNLAFESLTLSTDGKTVYTATENALYQDGPAADLVNATPSRVLSFNKATGASGAEYVYVADPVKDAPIPAGSFITNGLVELLAISENEFLAVERSFSVGVGNSIRIYKTSLVGATDVSGFDMLPAMYTPMTKTLLFDFASTGILMDNIEGISFGPVLPNGSQSIVLVSDNNFSGTQFTQFIAMEVIPAPGSFALLAVAGLIAVRRKR